MQFFFITDTESQKTLISQKYHHILQIYCYCIDFYGDLVYKLKKIVGSNNFSAQFIKIISHHKKIGYNINVLQQTEVGSVVRPSLSSSLRTCMTP